MTNTLTFKSFGKGPVYEDLEIWLPLLLVENSDVHDAGPVITGKTFRGCRITGPAVFVPIANCSFDQCGFNAPKDDMRNLILEPSGPTTITGCIGFRDCRFERCEFLSVGFTGAPEFLAELRAIGPRTA